jgi:hypothetical protein
VVYSIITGWEINGPFIQKIWCSHSTFAEDLGLLGCNAVYVRLQFPTFWRIHVHTASLDTMQLKHSKEQIFFTHWLPTHPLASHTIPVSTSGYQTTGLSSTSSFCPHHYPYLYNILIPPCMTKLLFGLSDHEDKSTTILSNVTNYNPNNWAWHLQSFTYL